MISGHAGASDAETPRHRENQEKRRGRKKEKDRERQRKTISLRPLLFFSLIFSLVFFSSLDFLCVSASLRQDFLRIS
jgi:hypothetical protein